MNGSQADGSVELCCQELYNPAIGAVTDQNQAQHQLIEPGRCDWEIKEHVRGILGRRKCLVQCGIGFVFLLVDELTADFLLDSKSANRCASRQRLNGDLLTGI
jgi:hypothetical protein